MPRKSNKCVSDGLIQSRISDYYFHTKTTLQKTFVGKNQPCSILETTGNMTKRKLAFPIPDIKVQTNRITVITQYNQRELPFPVPVYKTMYTPSTSKKDEDITSHKYGKNKTNPENETMRTSPAKKRKVGKDNASSENDGNKTNRETGATPTSSPRKKIAQSQSLQSNKKKSKTTPPATPKKRSASSPKSENKINQMLLKVINDLIKTVFDTKSLSQVLDEETRTFNILQSEKPEYQYISFKLYTRLPRWFNLFKFCGDYMNDLSEQEVIQMYNFLKSNEFVDTDYTEENLETMLNLLTVKNIADICKKFRIPKDNKDKMIKGLLTNSRIQPTVCISKTTKDLLWDEVCKNMGKYVVKIKDTFQRHMYHVYLLGTFTNSNFRNINDFFRMMLESKPDFPDFIIENYMVFYDRQEFLNYAKACEDRDSLEVLIKYKMYWDLLKLGNDIFETLRTSPRCDDDRRFTLAPHLKRFTADSVYCSNLTKICETLKAKYPTEIKIFVEYLIESFPNSHRIGIWYMLLCDIYMLYIKDFEKAAELVVKALGERREFLAEHQIHDFGEKGKQLKKKVYQYLCESIVELSPVGIRLEDFPQTTVDAKTVRNNETGNKRLYEVCDQDGNKTYKTVEEVAVDYYIDNCGYTKGKHCEGSIIMNTFTLFFWDIIYNQNPIIPGTFLSKLQQYPLDMFTPYFYKNRKVLIDKRLKDIAEDLTDEETLKIITQNWNLYSHISGLRGPILDEIPDINFLKIVVNCIGRKTLSKIYERLVKDVRQYRSGMPDLFLWNEKEKTAKFVEVKGENDRLSTKQKLWLKYLQSIPANIEVCHVHSIGSKRKATGIQSITNNNEDN